MRFTFHTPVIFSVPRIEPVPRLAWEFHRERNHHVFQPCWPLFSPKQGIPHILGPVPWHSSGICWVYQCKWIDEWMDEQGFFFFSFLRLALGNLETATLSFYLWFYFLLVLPRLNFLRKCTHSDLLFHLDYFVMRDFLPYQVPNRLLFVFSSQN